MNPNVKATASYLPGTTSWTVAVFEAVDVPAGTQVQPVSDVENRTVDSSVAAIQYALSHECSDDSDMRLFLKWWNEGEFDKIRKEFPTAPEEVFMTADPLYNKRPKV